MSWGLTFVIALLTAFAGAASAGLVAGLCVDWFRISPREGGSGYFVIFISLAGLMAGFIIGAITSRVVQSGFWLAQAYSLAVVVGICLVVGIVARMFGEVAPSLNGDGLTLEVELKCPRGWQPDNKAKHSSGTQCLLQPMGMTQGTMGPYMHGSVDWKSAKEVDGQWIVACAVDLFTSRRNRYVRVILGDKTDVTFLLPMPGNPSAENLQWSGWSNKAFNHPVGQPPITDYEFRYRVKPDTAVRDEKIAADAAIQAAVDKAITAIPSNAPIEAWLPFFGSPDSFEGSDYRAVEAVKARASDLKAPLLSNNPVLIRQAVCAAASLSEVPPDLIEPLQKAGRQTIDLIKDARAHALPNDPDLRRENLALSYFFRWGLAMTMAGEAAKAGQLIVLKEIEQEVGKEAKGDLGTLESYCSRDIEKLSAVPQAAAQ